MAHHFEKVSMFTGQNSHIRLVLLWKYGDEEHGNLSFKFLYSSFNEHTFQIDRIPSNCEGTDEGRIFYERFGYVPMHVVISALRGGGTYDFWTELWYLNFWYLSGSNSTALLWNSTETAFCPTAVFENLCVHQSRF